MSTTSSSGSLLQHVVDGSIGAGSVVVAGVRWTLFRRGPVTVAYPKFPVGLIESDAALLMDFARAEVELHAYGVDLLRMSAPMTMLDKSQAQAVEETLLETRIENLQSWDRASVHASVRRKLRKGEAVGIDMQVAVPGDGSHLHSMYLRTLARRHGAIRYTRHYFDSLCAAQIDRGEILVAKAMIDDAIAGFIVVFHDGDISYYLHGGYADEQAAVRPGYFAMAWAIEQSRLRGSACFNFLVSPRDQLALLEYKESFGGINITRAYWQRPLSAIGNVVALGLRWQARLHRWRLDHARTANETPA